MPPSLRGRLLVPIVAVVSAFGPLNSATVLVALPALTSGLRVPVTSSTLVVLAYLVATTVCVPFAGPVADRWGRRSVILAALAGLGVASVVAATSGGIRQLVAARVLQALCTSMTLPAGMALIREHVEIDRRSRAFGTVTAAINASGVIAPLVGAVMLRLGGWRYVFLVNVPLAALVIAAAALALPPEPRRTVSGALWPRLDLFWRHDVAVSSGSAFLHTLGLYSVLIVLPFVFAGDASVHGLGPVLLLVTLTGCLVVGGPLGGRAATRFGRRRVAMGGLVITAGGFVLASSHPPLELLTVPLAVVGLGLGAGLPPLQAAAVDAVDHDDAAAAGSLLMVGRNAGALVGTLALGLVLGRVTPAAAYAPVMLLLGASALAAAGIASRLGRDPAPAIPPGRPNQPEVT
ncbi:MAG TPA: MFS transporter [Acidimicrobiales bacterium]|nr:MFS transporter [Acidimicrobiales bacterium]